MKNSIDQIFRAWNLFMRKPTGSFLIVNIDVIKTTVICFPFINPLSLPLASLLFSLLFTPFVYSSPIFFIVFIHLPLLISLPCVFDLASFSSHLLLCFIFRSLFSVPFHTSWFCPLSSSLLFWSSILPLVRFSLLSSFPPISSYSLILIPAHLFVIKYNKNV